VIQDKPYPFLLTLVENIQATLTSNLISLLYFIFVGVFIAIS